MIMRKIANFFGLDNASREKNPDQNLRKCESIFKFRFKNILSALSKPAENKPKPGRRRSGRLFGKPLEEEQVDLTTIPPGTTYVTRKRRQYDTDNDDMENRPFWLIRNNYQPRVPTFLQQRTTVPRTPLKKKWQIPGNVYVGAAINTIFNNYQKFIFPVF